MNEKIIKRFGVSMEEALLEKFDELIRKKGYPNRSEAVRDLVREALVKQSWEEEDHYVAGTILLFYDHHQRDIQHQLTSIQHQLHHQILATTHFHLDEHHCLEIIVIKGKAKELKKISDQMISLKGVSFGKLTVSPLTKLS